MKAVRKGLEFEIPDEPKYSQFIVPYARTSMRLFWEDVHIAYEMEFPQSAIKALIKREASKRSLAGFVLGTRANTKEYHTKDWHLKSTICFKDYITLMEGVVNNTVTVNPRFTLLEALLEISPEEEYSIKLRNGKWVVVDKEQNAEEKEESEKELEFSIEELAIWFYKERGIKIPISYIYECSRPPKKMPYRKDGRRRYYILSEVVRWLDEEE